MKIQKRSQTDQGTWRAPTIEDRERKCLARNRFEKSPFSVEWNAQHNCWAFSGRKHVLVLVSEILAPAGIDHD